MKDISTYDSALAVIEGNFYKNPDSHRQRITRKDLQTLLLANLRPMAKGNLWSIRHIHIAVGIYEIWFVRAT